ncbi:hypothetical protein [Actinacidiphila glaucinigra]|uniref:hypothetical protein n=1 Tax=Actinacidiphila glaucinigra TaxID=235986 RepID=UPI0033F5E5A9
MRAKRSIALLASPLVAAAALAFSSAVPATAYADTSHHATASAQQAPTKDDPKYQQGYNAGLLDGRFDGKSCSYYDSYSPETTNAKYKSGYSSGYNVGYNAKCDH